MVAAADCSCERRAECRLEGRLAADEVDRRPDDPGRRRHERRVRHDHERTVGPDPGERVGDLDDAEPELLADDGQPEHVADGQRRLSDRRGGRDDRRDRVVIRCRPSEPVEAAANSDGMTRAIGVPATTAS